MGILDKVKEKHMDKEFVIKEDNKGISIRTQNGTELHWKVLDRYGELRDLTDEEIFEFSFLLDFLINEGILQEYEGKFVEVYEDFFSEGKTYYLYVSESLFEDSEEGDVKRKIKEKNLEILSKSSRWNRKIISREEYFELIEKIKKTKRTAILFDGGIRVLDWKTIYILEEFLTEEGLTVGERAFKYIQGFKGVRYEHNADLERKKLKKQTMYFVGKNTWGNFVYLDVKNAYYSIYREYGINILYWTIGEDSIIYKKGDRNRNNQRYIQLFEELEREGKLVKNAVVGILTSTHMRVIEKGELLRKEKRVRNLGLFNFVNDYLRMAFSLAYYYIWGKESIVYINTDGMIIKVESEADYQRIIDTIKLFDLLGLELRVKAEGEGGVLDFGVYRVGDTKTKNYDRYRNRYLKYKQKFNLINTLFTTDELSKFVNLLRLKSKARKVIDIDFTKNYNKVIKRINWERL